MMKRLGELVSWPDKALELRDRLIRSSFLYLGGRSTAISSLRPIEIGTPIGFFPNLGVAKRYRAGHPCKMLAEVYIEALLTNESAADGVWWDLWQQGLISDALATLAWLEIATLPRQAGPSKLLDLNGIQI